MYVRRKVFSNVEQPVEEQLYSVTMTEEQYNLFSEFLEEREYASKEDKKEVAKDAAAGAGVAAAGIATAGAGTVGVKAGADKIVRNMAKKRTLKAVAEKNAIMKEAGEKAAEAAKKWSGANMKGVQKDMVNEALNAGKSKAAQVKVADAGKIEKGAAAIAKGGAAATKWVKNNPRLAAGIAAGTLVGGASIGAGNAVLHNKKKK